MFQTPSKHLEKAGLAWQRGDKRSCADSYRNAYEECLLIYAQHTSSSAKKWELEYCCISGYTSLFRENEITATEADFMFLKSVGLNSTNPICSAQAYLTRGLLYWDQGQREKAARQYRKGLERASNATKDQRARQEMLPIGGTYKLQVIEPLLNDIARTLRQNLYVLETGKTPADMFNNPAALKSGKVMAYPVQNGKLNPDQLVALTNVSGSQCNACGAVPAPQNTDASDGSNPPEKATTAGTKVSCEGLKMCQRCQRAWYCSRECQLAAWKSHKATCRSRYAFVPGDVAVLCNLNSQPELNGSVVTILARDEREMCTDLALQKWQVAVAGDKSIIVTASKLERYK